MTEEAKGQEPVVNEEPQTYDSGYVKELRQENAGWRTKLRETESAVETLTKKLKHYEDSQKSELERLTEEKGELEKAKDSLERQIESTQVDTAIKLAAAKEKVIDPEAVSALIDRSELTFIDGQVSGVEKALKRLLKDKPYLLAGDEPVPPPTPGVGDKPLDTNGAQSFDEAFAMMLKAGAKNKAL
jgi:chromosome segregation ATPase